MRRRTAPNGRWHPLKKIIAAPTHHDLSYFNFAHIVHGLTAQVDSAAPGGDARADYIDSYTGDWFAESATYVRTNPDQFVRRALFLAGSTLPSDHRRAVRSNCATSQR